MWIYTTSGVAQNAYGTTDTTSKAFQDAGDWVGVMFMVYNGVSALAAFLLPLLAAKISRKLTHMISLIIGGIGLIAIFFIKDSQMLLIPMIAVGLHSPCLMQFLLGHCRPIKWVFTWEYLTFLS
jgi:maltose/moltooligosaccharide transporter